VPPLEEFNVRDFLLSSSLLGRSNMYAWNLYTQHMAQAPSLMWPHQSSQVDRMAGMASYTQLPTVPMPIYQGLLNVPNMPSMGPLNSLMQMGGMYGGQALQNMLGMRGPQMPMFGRYNTLDVVRQQALAEQTFDMSQSALDEDVSMLQRTYGSLMGIGAGEGFPSEQGMRSARFLALGMGHFGAAFLPPGMYESLLPGGSARHLERGLWRAGRLASTGQGGYGLSAADQIGFRGQIKDMFSPSGPLGRDPVTALLSTSGLGIGKAGDVAYEMSRRGIGPEMVDTRVAGGIDERRVTEKYKNKLTEYTETIAILEDVFGPMGVGKLFQQLDRMTAGSTTQLGPTRARQLAQDISNLTYQLPGMTTEQITQTMMVTSAQARGAGLQGYVGTDIGTTALISGYQARGLMAGAPLAPTAAVIQQGTVERGFREMNTEHVRKFGAVLRHWYTGMRGVFSEDEKRALEIIQSDRPSTEKRGAMELISERLNPLTERILKRAPSFARTMDDPLMANYASRAGYGQLIGAQRTTESAANVAAEHLQNTLGFGRERAERVVLDISSGRLQDADGRQESMESFTRRMLLQSSKDNLTTDEEVYATLNAMQKAAIGLYPKSPTAHTAGVGITHFQGARIREVLAGRRGEWESIANTFKTELARGRMPTLGRFIEAAQEVASRSGVPEKAVLGEMTRHLGQLALTDEMVGELSGPLQRQFRAAGVLYTSKELEALEKTDTTGMEDDEVVELNARKAVLKDRLSKEMGLYRAVEGSSVSETVEDAKRTATRTDVSTGGKFMRIAAKTTQATVRRIEAARDELASQEASKREVEEDAIAIAKKGNEELVTTLKEGISVSVSNWGDMDTGKNDNTTKKAITAKKPIII